MGNRKRKSTAPVKLTCTAGHNKSWAIGSIASPISCSPGGSIDIPFSSDARDSQSQYSEAPKISIDGNALDVVGNTANEMLNGIIDPAAQCIELDCVNASENVLGRFTARLADDPSFSIGESVQFRRLYIAADPGGIHFMQSSTHAGRLSISRVIFSEQWMASALLQVASQTQAVKLSITHLHGTELFVQVMLTDRAALRLTSTPTVWRHLARLRQAVRAAMMLTGHLPQHWDTNCINAIIPEPSKHGKCFDLNAFYHAVKNKPYFHQCSCPGSTIFCKEPAAPELPSVFTHPALVPVLRPYQSEAVHWMICREKGVFDSDYRVDVQSLFKPLQGTNLYHNEDSSALLISLPELRSPAGGILADEMGLGKTVEVLACLLCNPREPPVMSLTVPLDHAIVKGPPFLESQSWNSHDEARIIPDRISSQTTKFECLCGRLDDELKVAVECTVCGLQQHAVCVSYDLASPNRGVYKCPHCHAASEPCPSGATLIVVPNSIKMQWMEEIRRHINLTQFRVLDYEGVSGASYIQPSFLAAQDIVMTTYDVLSRELRATSVPHSNSQSGRVLRRPKRFMAVPSPLVAVEWWRICLDEAQMVESVSTKTAEMALKLSAVNRWCVTGTPISTGVKDLYGLLLFLGVQPFCLRPIWDAILYQPLCEGRPFNMYTLLNHFLWRTCKADVTEQIGIPPQTEQMHYISFSPVEEHFYRSQFHECRADFMKVITKFEDRSLRLDTLDRHSLSMVLEPLLRMRQACCHPQVVRGEFSSPSFTPLTMDDLLVQMTHKVKVSCEEAHRQIVAGLNGQAAVLIIRKRLSEAIEKYRKVLRSSEEHRSLFGTDDMQLLHTTYNLRYILPSVDASPEAQAECSLLASMETEIKRQYLNKFATKVSSSQQAVSEYQQNINENILMSVANYHPDGLMKVNSCCWWAELIDLTHDQHSLLMYIESALSKSVHAFQASSYRTIGGLIYQLVKDWTDLRFRWLNATKSLEEIAEQGVGTELVTAVVCCCLRPDGTSTTISKCPLCKTATLLTDYEFKLFLFTERYKNDADEEHLKGTWADSVLELTLKAILGYSKLCLKNVQMTDSDKYISELMDAGFRHIRTIGYMKKQFKPLRALWMALRERITAFDELNMAILRFQERKFNENVPDGFRHIVDAADLDTLLNKQISQEAHGRSDLDRLMRQLSYLKGLANMEINPTCGNTDLCPICRQILGHKWAVFQCCHCFCLDCTRVLTSQSSALPCLAVHRGTRYIKCAVCRELTTVSDVAYVSTRIAATSHSSTPQIPVIGRYSSKVTEVVRCLKVIAQHEPGAKALVFSSWPNLLDVIAKALIDNGILFRQLKGRKLRAFQDSLLSFQKSVDIEALLLPVSSGANGLNLIEATHVLLLEPLLSPGVEAQAVGRIHRIGQTRPTFVHKFIVEGSIEEKIYRAVGLVKEEDNMSSGELPLTLEVLSQLFDCSATFSTHSF